MSIAGDARKLLQPRGRSVITGSRNQRSSRRVRLSHLRKLRDCEQVAAVCYRIRRKGIEFLLVQTRGSGRWTFPKGNAEPGMTHAQAAALEAFEEAGVHGRIEEASFASYTARKRALTVRSVEKGLAVNAHLCEVLRLGSPTESNRNRTWFSIEDAKLNLREGRKSVEANGFSRVVDRAVERINRLQGVSAIGMLQRDFDERPALEMDPLQRVRFEVPAEALVRYLSPQAGGMRRSLSPPVNVQSRKVLECEVLPFAAPAETNRNAEWLPGRKKPKALGTGSRS